MNERNVAASVRARLLNRARETKHLAGSGDGGMTAELDMSPIVPIEAYRSTRAFVERERANVDQATQDLYFAIRAAYLLLSDSRRRLGLPPLPMPAA